MPVWDTVFPQLSWITDEQLRASVADVWDEAFRLGGWTESDLATIPFTLLVSESGVTLIEHTRIVTTLARDIASVMSGEGDIPLNHDHLIAGALLHDVGKLLEYRRDDDACVVSKSGKMLRHPLSGMGLAMRGGLPEEVCHIIAVHSREGDKSYRSPEAVILHHADFIAFESIKAQFARPE